jgi:hypothetical protein
MSCWASIPSIWFPFQGPVVHNEPTHCGKLATVFSAVCAAVYGPAITPGWQSPDWQPWPIGRTLVNTNIISMQFLILTSPLPSTSSGELFHNQLRRAHLLLMVKFFFWPYERVTLPARCSALARR